MDFALISGRTYEANAIRLTGPLLSALDGKTGIAIGRDRGHGAGRFFGAV
jgi:hypothetical protein